MTVARDLRVLTSPDKRSRLEDRLTLFDESGVVVISDRADLLELIRERSWIELFWNRRAEVLEHLEIWVTGHGLYEQLLTPFVGLVGYGRLYLLNSEEFGTHGVQKQRLIDLKISRDLERCSLDAPRALHAIPILGYPRWYEANQERSFYENAKYFRGPYT